MNVENPVKSTSHDEPNINSQLLLMGLEGEILMNAAVVSGVPFQQACGGNAECTTCHMYVPLEVRQNQAYEDMGEKELSALEFAAGFTDESRLAC